MILIFICVVLLQFKRGCGCSDWGDLSFDVEAGLRRPAAVGARHGVGQGMAVHTLEGRRVLRLG